MKTTVIPSGSIVVGVDGSTSSQRALEWAIEQAVLEHRPLTLVHGLEPGTSAWIQRAGLDHNIAMEAMREDAHLVLDGAREEVTRRAPQVEVHEVLQVQDPRDLLLEVSKHAAMVILGSRGRGTVKSLLLGSVSLGVSRHASCPVVVLRPRNGNLDAERRGVLVGVDGTERSLAALEFAYRQASLRSLPLTVLHCFWDVRSSTVGPGLVKDSEPGHDELWLLMAESVSGMGEKFPDVHVEMHLARGLVDDCLTRAATPMDMVVVGTHHSHPVSGVVHGSVAATVVEHAVCIVVVVPGTESEGDPAHGE